MVNYFANFFVSGTRANDNVDAGPSSLELSGRRANCARCTVLRTVEAVISVACANFRSSLEHRELSLEQLSELRAAACKLIRRYMRRLLCTELYAIFALPLDGLFFSC